MPSQLPRYKRTMGSWFEDHEEFTDETIVIYQKKPYLHPSIMYKISSFLSTKDFLNFGMSCKPNSSFMTDIAIVQNIVKDFNPIGALGTTLYSNQKKYTKMIIDKYDISLPVMFKGLIQSIMEHKNDVANVLFDSVCTDIKISDYFGEMSRGIDDKCHCVDCFRIYMNDPFIKISELTTHAIIIFAIKADNLEMFQLIKTKYSIPYCQFDLIHAMYYCSKNIAKFLCIDGHSKMKEEMIYRNLEFLSTEDLCFFIDLIPTKNKFIRRNFVTVMIDIMLHSGKSKMLHLFSPSIVVFIFPCIL